MLGIITNIQGDVELKINRNIKFAAFSAQDTRLVRVGIWADMEEDTEDQMELETTTTSTSESYTESDSDSIYCRISEEPDESRYTISSNQ